MMSLEPKLGAASPPTSAARQPRPRQRARAPVSAHGRPAGSAGGLEQVRGGWDDLTRLRALLREAAGMALNQQTKATVYARMVPRVRSLGCASFTEHPLEAIAARGGATARRFCLRGAGARAGKAKVRPERARLISFGRLNLCEEHWQPTGELEAIFCCNVMIGLDRAVQRRMLDRFAACRKPRGLLFTGHSENRFGPARDLFRRRARTVCEPATPTARRSWPA
jgi:chemotaxis methyl-accepting protein methylase